MGNICRSPSAEGFLRARLPAERLVDQVGTDSAGTHSYHVGHAPDHRAIEVAADYDVDISDLRARRVTEEDFHHFDLVIAMDEANLRQLQALQRAAGPGARADLRLMMDFAANGGGRSEVPDPYYGGLDDFRLMCDLLKDATDGLLVDIRRRIGANVDDRHP